MTMEEKRKYPRFDVVAKVKFRKSKNLSDLKEAFVKDISAEGFCFCSSEQLKPGETLEVEIIEQAMQEEPIVIKGQVAWCEKVSGPKDGANKDAFLTGVKVLGVRGTDEARFAMFYCERVIAELRGSLRKQ